MTKIHDRVKENCTVTGTGDITTIGAVDASFFAYSDKYTGGELVPYCVVENITNFEIGVGVFTLATSLIARTASGVTESSNAGGLVTFGAGATICFASFSANEIDNIKQGISTLNNNISLLHFYRAIDHGISVQDMVDGYVDEFEDETGISVSTGITYDPAGNLYHNIPAVTDLVTSSVAYDGSFSIAGQDIYPRSVRFSSDGTKMYCTGDSADSVYQFTLTTPWSTQGTVTYNGSLSVASQTTTPSGLFFSSDGTVMFVIGTAENAIYQYTLTTPWSITGTVTYSGSISITAQDTDPFGLFFSSDGTVMFFGGASNDFIHQYTLTTPWSITGTVTYNGSFSLAGQQTAVQGLAFDSSGTYMYVVGISPDSLVKQYTLTTPWSITGTVTYNGSFDTVAQIELLRGLVFSDDNTVMYVSSFTGSAIYQYTLSGLPTDILLQPVSKQAITQPDTINLVLFQEDIDALVLNTDLIASVSRDLGVTYSPLTLENIGTSTGGKNILAAEVSVADQPVGLDISYKITTANSKATKLHGVSLQWR